jgi:hypothetical protein
MGKIWMTDNITTPSAKNVESTTPIAASDPRRVLFTRYLTAAKPAVADRVDPTKSTTRLRPLPPKADTNRNAIANPARVEWEIASLNNEFLRMYRYVPHTPALAPRTVALNTIRYAL